MTLPRFFIRTDQITDGRAVMAGRDARHLVRSLRAQTGDRVVLVDDAGREHGLLLDEFGPDRVAGALEWTRPATGEPGVAVHLLHALAKDGMCEAIDAMAALGAASIRPCITERTISRPEPSRQGSRVDRWQDIARGAAQQSGRGAIPTVHPIRPLAEACAELPAGARILACVVDGDSVPLSRIDVDAEIPLVLCIGPEGDFGPTDLEMLARAGAESTHIGPRVLRSRIAGSVALSLVLARAGAMDSAACPPPPVALA